MVSEIIANKLSNARHVAVLTGAGVSAESGVPTFRDAGGLWAKYDPQQLATEAAFRADPDLVWRWYSWRRQLIANVNPNPGHFALAALHDMFPRFSLVTQNVDNLHQRAGSREVHELHGNIERSRCMICEAVFHGDEAPPGEHVLQCSCGGAIRPDVVWFGEQLPEKELRFATEAAVDCDVFLTIGTSGQVYPAAQLPLIAKQQGGAMLIEINPEPSALASMVDECICSPSGEVLPRLLDAIKAAR